MAMATIGPLSATLNGLAEQRGTDAGESAAGAVSRAHNCSRRRRCRVFMTHRGWRALLAMRGGGGAARPMPAIFSQKLHNDSPLVLSETGSGARPHD